LREAVAHFKKSLQQDPGNKRAKQNLEMANTLMQRLLARQEKQQQQGQPDKTPEPDARAKEALARALQLAQERRYPEAAAVLDEMLRTNRTAASFASHRQRLDDVMKIMRGEAPTPPASGATRDPRSAPWRPGPPGRSGP
jgi:thioredoxin-like negative regulator of GroEL